MSSYTPALLLTFLIYASSQSISADANKTHWGGPSDGPPCECVFGILSATEPYCTCVCEADYAPPHCLSRVKDMQTLRITMNWTAATMSTFSSMFLERSLREFSHLDAEEGKRDIIFRLREIKDTPHGLANYSEIIYVNVLVRSPYVIPILDAFHSYTNLESTQTSLRTSWIAQLGVINIYALMPVTTDDDSFGPSYRLATPYKGVNITLDTIVWIVVLILVITIMLVTDAVLGSITDDPRRRLNTSKHQSDDDVELYENELQKADKRKILAAQERRRKYLQRRE